VNGKRIGVKRDPSGPNRDRDILRPFGERIAEIAALPQQKSTKEMWRRLNSLDMAKPMVMMHQIPWGEMNFNDELTTRCTDPYCRSAEEGLRRRLYQWEHMRADMVVEPVVDVEPVLQGDDYGIAVGASGFGAHRRVWQLREVSGCALHWRNAHVLKALREMVKKKGSR